MKVGQIVKYRPWREGDTPIDSVPMHHRGWDRTGIVIRVCDWSNAGTIEKNAGIEYLDSDGSIILAHRKDLIMIEKGTRGSD